MKNPNHYGTVTKLSGNRRNPWVAREGRTGRQHVIGYAPTKQEALILLAKYNDTPWDIQAKKLTLGQLYGYLDKYKLSKMSESTVKRCHSAWRYLEPYSHYNYATIKSQLMQSTIDSCDKSNSLKQAVKTLWYHLDNYAMELGCINSKQSELITVHNAPESHEKAIFTNGQVTSLWTQKKTLQSNVALILLYSGLRINELLKLKLCDVDLEQMTMSVGSKTQAGYRTIPIHSKIQPLIYQCAKSNSTYLIEREGQPLTYGQYYKLWQTLGFDKSLTPHSCRHTFRTELDRKNANQVCVDRLMGHKSQSVGEAVYTHKSLEELRSTLELVTY